MSAPNFRLAVTLSLLFALPATAQVQSAFEAPTIVPGDKWSFRTSKDGGKTWDGGWSRQVERVEGDRLIVSYGSGAVHYYDLLMNYSSDRPADTVTNYVKYPLRVGDEWSTGRRYVYQRPQAEQMGTAKAVALETVTVPAGTFECIRVDSESSYAAIKQTTYSKVSRWYCPQIKWIAKEVVDRLLTSNWELGSRQIQISELRHFTPGH